MKIINKIRRRIINWLWHIDWFQRLSIRGCVDNSLLPSIIVKTPSNIVRNIFNLPYLEHETQLNQDVFALLMSHFNAGYFVEIGANDGFTLSNSIYLEQKFGWQGVLIEANPKYLPSLTKRNNSIIINKAISSTKGQAEFIDADLYGGLAASLDSLHSSYTKAAKRIIVECAGLQEIFDEVAAPKKIDFISIDVEGGEVPVVEQMVSCNRRFRCGCIECNYRNQDIRLIVDLLESSGYQIVWKNQTAQDLFFTEK